MIKVMIKVKIKEEVHSKIPGPTKNPFHSRCQLPYKLTEGKHCRSGMETEKV